MATATCNGAPVVEARISLPRVGVWSAVVVVEQEEALSGAATLSFGDGEASLVGTSRHAGAVVAAANAFVVGGADGMGTQARPRFYRQAQVKDVVNDLLADAGEVLASTADASLLATRLPFWTTMAQPVGEAVANLLRACSGSPLWRVLRSGAVWLGSEAWPSQSGSYVVTEEKPEEQVLFASMDWPCIWPGEKLSDGRKVDRVEYQIQGQRCLGTVFVF